MVRAAARIVVLFLTLAGVLGVSNAHASATDVALAIAAPGAVHAARDVQCDAWLAKQPSVREARATRAQSLDLAAIAAAPSTRARRLAHVSLERDTRHVDPVYALPPARARAWLMVFHI